MCAKLPCAPNYFSVVASDRAEYTWKNLLTEYEGKRHENNKVSCGRK